MEGNTGRYLIVFISVSYFLANRAIMNYIKNTGEQYSSKIQNIFRLQRKGEAEVINQLGAIRINYLSANLHLEPFGEQVSSLAR
jgi:hypothetical protein